MPRIGDYTRGESKYLRAEDLRENERVKLKIEQIKIELIEQQDSGKKQDKAVVYFSGWDRDRRDLEDKGLVLNQVNGAVLTEAFGETTEECEGNEVILFRTTTQFGRKMVPCLRLDIPSQYSEPIGAEAHKSTDQSPPPDDIPF